MRDDLRNHREAHMAMEESILPRSALCELCETAALCMRHNSRRPCECAQVLDENQGRGTWQYQAAQRQERLERRLARRSMRAARAMVLRVLFGLGVVLAVMVAGGRYWA